MDHIYIYGNIHKCIYVYTVSRVSRVRQRYTNEIAAALLVGPLGSRDDSKL